MTLLAVVPSLSSSYDDGDDDVGRCSPHHIQAQRLNNTAATCIEIGNELRGRGGKRGRGRGQQQKYEKAISILAKALRICEIEEEQEHQRAYDVCSCHYCSLDGCIVSSEVDDNDHYHDNDNDNADFNNINEGNNDGTHIYQRPIYVQEGHNMGVTLTHIIAFNLAVVYHLCFVMADSNHDDIDNTINKALQFYEHAYECNLSDTCSIRFDEMICNNLSHIYCYQEQTEEERTFQQQEQQKTLEQEKESLHHLQEPISVSDDEDDNDDDVSNSSFDDIDDLLELESYSHDEVEQEEYEHERNRKRKHTHKLTTTQRQRNKLLHNVDDDLDHQYHTVIDTCSVSHTCSSHGSGVERDIIQGEGGWAY